jgi:hypothetical protein
MRNDKRFSTLFLTLWFMLFAVITSPWLILIAIVWLLFLGQFLLPVMFVISLFSIAWLPKVLLIPLIFIDRFITVNYDFSKTKTYEMISGLMFFLTTIVISVGFSLYIFNMIINLNSSHKFYFPTLVFIYLISFMPTLAMTRHASEDDEFLNLLATFAVLTSFVSAIGLAFLDFNFDNVLVVHTNSVLLFIGATISLIFLKTKRSQVST